MRDDRTFIRVHDGMPDHPKIEALSDKAFRLLVERWCWCSRHRTDGRIPMAVWLKENPAARRELVEAELVEDHDGFVMVHDYLEHQRSAEEIAESTEVKRRRAVLGNHTRWHVQCKKNDPSCPYCFPEGSTGDPKAIPDESPGSPKSSSATETDIKEPPKPPKGGRRQRYDYGNDETFQRFWAAYPEKAGKSEAYQAWLKALKRGVDPERIIYAAARYRDDPHRNPDKTKYPQGWLNGERYLDEPAQINGTARRGWWDN